MHDKHSRFALIGYHSGGITLLIHALIFTHKLERLHDFNIEQNILGHFSLQPRLLFHWVIFAWSEWRLQVLLMMLHFGPKIGGSRIDFFFHPERA